LAKTQEQLEKPPSNKNWLAGLGSLGNRSKNALDKITQKNIVKTRLKNRKFFRAQFFSDPPEGQVRLRDVRPLA